MFGSDGLTPSGRKALYSVGSALVLLAAYIGFAPGVSIENWVEVAVQVVGVVGLVVASIKAKRVDYTAFYAAGAALVAALTVVGVLNSGQEQQVYDILAQITAAVPLVIAVLRTNTTVPTGEPVDEYAAKHSGLSSV